MPNRMLSYPIIAGAVLIFIILVGGITESNADGFVELNPKKLTKNGYQKKRAELHISRRCKTGIAEMLDELNEVNDDLGDIAEKLEETRKLVDESNERARYLRDYEKTFDRFSDTYLKLTITMGNLEKLIIQATKKKKLLKCYAKTKRTKAEGIEKKEQFVSF